MASHAPGARPVWWPTEADLGAMVGLARCDGRERRGRPCADAIRSSDEQGREQAPAALAARLSGLLRAGC